MSLGQIVMTIKAVDEASSVMDQVKASVGLVGAQLEQLGGGFATLGQVVQGFAVAGPAGAAIVGVGQLAKGVQDAVGVAGASETAWAGLQSALQLVGAAWDTQRPKLEDLTKSLSTMTSYGQTETVGALQTMATYGMNASQAMDGLKAAVDLAAAKHVDLETAATALGKAFQGNTMLMARMGVETSTMSKETSLGTEAIKELGAKLDSGTTPALASFAGAMTAAGLQTTDSNGKMLGHAAIVKEITDAWKAGTIDGNQLSAIVGALGITFQGNKALAMDYAAVLTQVNAQYGGTAVTQAATYAGSQERLKNAMDNLATSVGNGLIPFLTSLDNAMVGIVGDINGGVTAIGNWIGEIEKIPAVKGAVDTVQQAWAGLQKSFNDAWNLVSKDFKPALDDLSNAFGELNKALQPLWDALNELWKALTGDKGDFNLFQAILEALVVVIKGIAEVIRLAAPVVQLFAEAFKTLADFVAPAIAWLRDTIGGFIKWITDAFQGFYDWLVGHSLWQDLWNAVLTIATTAITTIVGRIASGLFDWLKSGFTSVVSAISGTWNGIVGAITTPLDQVASAIQAKFPELAQIITGGTDVLKGDWVTGLGQMAAAVPGAFGEIGSAISTALTGAATSLWNGITGALAGADKAITGWYSSLSASDPMKGLIDSVISGVGKLTGAVSGIPSTLAPVGTAMNTALSEVGTAAAGALTTASSTVSTAAGTIATTLTTAATNWTTPIQNWVHWLVGGSVWPDTWTAVQAITDTSAGAITNLLRTSLTNWATMFNDGMNAMANFWNTGLQLIVSTTTTGIATLGAAFTGFFNLLTQGRILWTDLSSAVTLATTMMKATVQDFLTWLVKYWTDTFNKFTVTFTAELAAVQAVLVAGTAAMQSTWNAALNAMVSSTEAAFQAMVNDIRSQVNTIISILEAAKAKVSTHSIWPDMLAEMVAQTHAGMAAIQGEFAGGFESPSGIIPTIQGGGAAMAAAAPNTAPAAGAQGGQAITLPINVYLDGQQIQSFMEKRMVDTLRQNAGRSKRSGRV